MSESKPKFENGSEGGETRRIRFHQAISSNFICKKEKPVRRCEDIKNDVFNLVPHGQTNFFANFLKAFYYICGINFQKNASGSVKNLSKPTVSAPTERSFERGKTAITMV